MLTVVLLDLGRWSTTLVGSQTESGLSPTLLPGPPISRGYVRWDGMSSQVSARTPETCRMTAGSRARRVNLRTIRLSYDLVG